MNTQQSNLKDLIQAWILYDTYRIPNEKIEMLAGTQDDIQTKLKAIFICAAADGEISEAESRWIQGLSLALGCSVEFIETLKHYSGEDSEEVFQTLANNVHRSASWSNAVIYQAIRACAADGEFTDKEKEKIDSMAKQLNVSKNTVSDIIAVFKEEEALKQKIGRLIGYSSH